MAMNIEDKIFFLRLARFIAEERSRDFRKVGAVIVNDKKQIVSVGYNGFPSGVEDLEERYLNREIKLKFVVHAEANAILHAYGNIENCTIFTYPLFPCHECAKMIIEKGIKKVISVHTSDPSGWEESTNFSKVMFDEAGIPYEIIPLEYLDKKVRWKERK